MIFFCQFFLIYIYSPWTFISAQENTTTNSTLLKIKFANALANTWETINPDVSKTTLLELPLDILYQVNPEDPASLIGCPNGTTPFNLESCTEGIVAFANLTGWCPHENALYDEESGQCSVTTTTEPYVSCPEGYRITLPPHSIFKGPCQHSEAIPGIPYCDPPYKLSLEHGYCFLRQAALGNVTCNFGEKRIGDTCIAAFQVPLDIECPKNFTAQENLNKISCVKETYMSGTWNIYTQKAVCPSSYHSIIDRQLKKKKNPSKVFNNIQSIYTDINNYHLPLNLSPKNVSCVKTERVFPLNITCPVNTTDFFTYVKNTKNEPLVQMNDEIVVPSHSCVEVKNFTVIPSCSQTKSRIHIDGVENVLQFLKEKFYKTNHSVPVNETDVSPSNTTTLQPPVVRQIASKRNWVSLETSLELLPTTIVMESTDEESLHRNNGSLLPHTRLYSRLNRTRVSDVLYQNETLPDPLTNESLVVDWNVLRSIHDLATALESLSFTTLDVDWKHLHDTGAIRIICETTTTNEFYLACPSKYRLRIDGSCIGTGHTDFLFLCPTNYVLDDVAMIHHSVHHPKPRCIGKTPAYTKYACQNYTFYSDSNATDSQNETLLTLNSTQNQTLPTLNSTQNETLLTLNSTQNETLLTLNSTQNETLPTLNSIQNETLLTLNSTQNETLLTLNSTQNETLLTLNSTQNDTINTENAFQNETFNSMIPLNATSNFSCSETNKIQKSNFSLNVNISKCQMYAKVLKMHKELGVNESLFIPNQTSTNEGKNTSVKIYKTQHHNNSSQFLSNTTLVLTDYDTLPSVNDTEFNTKLIPQSSLKKNTTTLLHVVADEYKSTQDKKCYAVKKTIKASYTPTYETMEGLYGTTATVEFLTKIAEGDKLNISIFFDRMAHLQV